MEQLYKEYSFEETLVEVTWIEAAMTHSGTIVAEDAADAKNAIFQIAKAIDNYIKVVRPKWELKGNYYDYIWDYTTASLAKMFPHNKEVFL